MKGILTIVLCCALFATAANSQRRVLFIGDSITDGNWGTNCNGERNLTDMNHIFGHGYMYLCASYFMGAFPERGYEFFNRGISGNTIVDLEKRWQTDALDLHPDILSVLVGINDIILNNGQDVDTVAFEAKYRALLDKSLAENPSLVIVLGEPFWQQGFRVDTEGFVERNCLALARATRRIANDYNAIFLEYQPMFDALCSKGNITYWIWDGVHPTPAGHYRMSRMWIEAMGEIMK